MLVPVVLIQGLDGAAHSPVKMLAARENGRKGETAQSGGVCAM